MTSRNLFWPIFPGVQCSHGALGLRLQTHLIFLEVVFETSLLPGQPSCWFQTLGINFTGSHHICWNVSFTIYIYFYFCAFWGIFLSAHPISYTSSAAEEQNELWSAGWPFTRLTRATEGCGYLYSVDELLQQKTNVEFDLFQGLSQQYICSVLCWRSHSGIGELYYFLD